MLGKALIHEVAGCWLDFRPHNEGHSRGDRSVAGTAKLAAVLATAFIHHVYTFILENV